MTNIVQTTASKAIVAFVAAAMIFTMFATPAKAQTIEDLQKMINDLMAQIAALQSGATTGSGATTCAPIPHPLTIGSTGANVTALQNYLISAGQSIPAGATGYFGTQTQGALAAWQAANGVAPAVGYYGPITAAAISAKCTPVAPTPGDDGDDDTTTGGGSTTLQGGEGYIDVTALTDSDIKIDLGKAEEVIVVEVEALDSDVAINRVDFMFTKRPWLYFAEVNLLVNGEEVASMSRSSDFSEVGSNYRARFSGLNLVVREDETVEVALELVVLSTMAGSRETESVGVWHPRNGIRFVDAAGISDTAPTIGFPNDDTDDTPLLVTFEPTFGLGELRTTLSDSSPENATVVVSETSNTNGVEVLVFEAEARESKVTVKDVTVTLTTGGDDNTPANVFSRAYLFAGNTQLSSKSVPASGNVVFNDLDAVINEDDIVDMRVVVDFRRGNQMGTTTGASFTVGTVTIVAENEDFANASPAVLTVNEQHTIVQDGLVAKAKSMTVTKNNNNTTLVVKLDVTAYGEDFWISATTATSMATAFTVPATTTPSVAPEITVSGLTKNSDGNFRITRGQTREITATFTFTNNGIALQYVTGNLGNLVYGPAASNAIGKTFPLTGPEFNLPTIEVSQPTTSS